MSTHLYRLNLSRPDGTEPDKSLMVATKKQAFAMATHFSRQGYSTAVIRGTVNPSLKLRDLLAATHDHDYDVVFLEEVIIKMRGPVLRPTVL